MSNRPTSHNYRKLARRMQDAQVKNSVSSSRYSGRSHGRAANVRYARGATRGEIHQVLPNTSTREDAVMYRSRMSRRSYVERNIAEGRRRKLLTAGLLAVIAVVIACIVGSFVFVSGLDARLALSDQNMSSVLASDSGEENATYTLLAADFDDSDETSPDALVLARTDTVNNRAVFISIPANTRVSVNAGTTSLGELGKTQGCAAVVEAVDDLLDVQVSHYVACDAQGFKALVDAFGGVEVTLDADVKDAQAGAGKLEAGTQTLSGEQAVFACRANDYTVNAEETRQALIAQVASSLFKKAQGMASGIGFMQAMDSLANDVSCDMGAMDAGSFLDSLRGISADAMYVVALPTYASTSNGTTYQVLDSTEFDAMMQRVRAGESPQVDASAVVSQVNAADYSISIDNGGDVAGAATEAADLLEAAGFTVEEPGNTSMQVYEETLVIYSTAEQEAAAEAIVATLGCGRALQDTIHYNFDTDIYIVVGKDWRTVLAARGQAVDEDGNIVTQAEADALDALAEANEDAQARSSAADGTTSTEGDGQ